MIGGVGFKAEVDVKSDAIIPAIDAELPVFWGWLDENAVHNCLNIHLRVKAEADKRIFKNSVVGGIGVSNFGEGGCVEAG